MKTKLLTLFCCLLSATTLFAYDVQVGGLYYNLLKSNNAKVTYINAKTEDFTSYNIGWDIKKAEIPSSISVNGQTYRVISIGGCAFRDCSSLTSVTIPNSVTTIECDAFENCSSLTSVTIPNSVTSIGNSAFRDCSSLTSVTIPNSVTTIGGSTFYNCTGLTSITIPNSVTTIGDCAFMGCSSLTSVAIPNSVTTIECDAFENCSSLTSVTIPNSVTTIGNYAFNCCSSLKSIDVATNNPNYCSVDGVLFDKNKTKLMQYPAGKTAASYTIPNSVTSIGYYAFSCCSILTSVTIPNSVTTIENDAFENCSSLTSVAINMTIIKGNAFNDCPNLKNVVFGESVTKLRLTLYNESIETITCYSMRPPTVEDQALSGMPRTTIVYVPADAYDTYKKAPFWRQYDVRPIGAAAIETNEVTVTPTETTADVAWPVVTNAATYELVIKDKSGNTICTLVFNDKGQLTSIAFNAPDRDRSDMPEQAQVAGFSFTVTGLEQGTTYNYTLTAKNSGGNTIDTRTGSFTTDGATALENVSGTIGTSVRKVMENGVMYLLLPDGTHYDAHGIRVK